MRYLVFGDVHGNLPALEAMLAEEKENYDSMISHGDVVNYGPWSNECVDLLRSYECICLRGNHEDYFLEGEYTGSNIIPKTFFALSYQKFSRKDIISTYTNSHSIPGYKIVHTINDQYIFPNTDVDSLHLKEHHIIGHSHHQFLLEVNNFKLYNTGSVGQNRKYINRINYLIVDTEKDEVLMKALKYDVDIVINEMKHLAYPEICLEYYQNKERA